MENSATVHWAPSASWAVVSGERCHGLSPGNTPITGELLAGTVTIKFPSMHRDRSNSGEARKNAGAALESMVDVAVLVNPLLVVRISTDPAVRSGGIRKLTRVGLI
jgi:hypothetical protein